MASLGVSGHLVGPAAFKAVDGSFTRLVVGSIPIHSRHAGRCRKVTNLSFALAPHPAESGEKQA